MAGPAESEAALLFANKLSAREERLLPGIEGYLEEFTSEKARGDEGYVADKGLIPMPAEERKKFTADVGVTLVC